MVGRWSASSRQDIGSQRGSLVRLHVRVSVLRTTHICVCDMCVLALQFTYREPAKSRAVTRASPPFEHVLSNTNLYKARRHARMNGRASDSRDIRRRNDATLRDTRSVCQGVVSYAVFARLECTPDGLR